MSLSSLHTAILAITTFTLVAWATTARAEDETNEQRAHRFYQMGVSAINEGKHDLAKTSFHELLKIYPNHPQAKIKLASITPNLERLAANNRKATLAGVIIPEVDLEGTDLTESLEILKVQIAAASGNKVNPNFIVQDLRGAFKGRSVTLQLENIPADVLLGYIVDLVRGMIRYDKHAIIIVPRK